MERMLIAFGIETTILQVKGEILESWLDGDSEQLNDEISSWGSTDLGDKSTPDVGIWVWEGTPKEIYGKDEMDNPEYDYTDFRNGIWREPSLPEIAAAVVGVNPWENFNEQGD